MSSKQELIDEVMDNFDFSKVAKVMKATDWVWVTTQYEVPEESEIRKRVRELLNVAYDGAIRKEEDYLIGTGGFEATYALDCKLLSLKFILSSWEAGGDF